MIEDVTEMVYTEALALPEDLARDGATCTLYDHELLRWAAERLRVRVAAAVRENTP